MDYFVKIAEAYLKNFPDDKIKFIGIGNIPKSPAVSVGNTMAQTELEKFYASNVDIIYAHDRTDYKNGWPLGGEAVLQGAILLFK